MTDGRRRSDARMLLACLVASIVAAVFAATEAALAVAFAGAMVAHVWCGRAGKVPGYVAGYLVLAALSWVSVQMIAANPADTLAMGLGSIGIVGRRALLPLTFAAALAEVPTGSLLAALRACRLPKSAGIALAVALRFAPTLSGEYVRIRQSQKFRGVGLGIVRTLAHLPSTAECILVPLVIRTMRVSDELSASITVRGVRFDGETTSFRPLSFSLHNAATLAWYCLCVALSVALAALTAQPLGAGA